MYSYLGDGAPPTGNKLFSVKQATNSLELAHQYTVKEGNVVMWRGMQFTPEMNQKAYERALAYKEANQVPAESGAPWERIVARCTQSGVNPVYNEIAFAGIVLDIFREYKPTTEQYQVSQARFAKLYMLDRHSSGYNEMVESLARKLRFVFVHLP